MSSYSSKVEKAEMIFDSPGIMPYLPGQRQLPFLVKSVIKRMLEGEIRNDTNLFCKFSFKKCYHHQTHCSIYFTVVMHLYQSLYISIQVYIPRKLRDTEIYHS